MFTDFKPIKGSLFNQRVNTFLGTIFLGTVALWASMFVWNIAEGSNPIDRALTSAIQQSLLDGTQ